MEPENFAPLEELDRLRIQITQAEHLDQLKPIFYRIEEILKQYAASFETQLAASEIKQRVVNRGVELRQLPPFEPGAPKPIAQTPAPAQAPIEAAPVILPPPVAKSDDADIAKATDPIAPAPYLPPPIAIKGPALPPNPLPVPDSRATNVPNMPIVPPRPVPVISPASDRDGPPSAGSGKWRGLLWAALALVALLAGFFFVRQSKQREVQKQAAAPVGVQIATEPSGASIRVTGPPVNGKAPDPQQCKSDCSLQLVPGAYTITATMDGYDMATEEHRVEAAKPSQRRFVLKPQPQTIRILADAPPADPASPKTKAAPATSQVTMDDQPAGMLTDGQLLLENVAPGSHRIHIVNGPVDVEFSVGLVAATLPNLPELIMAKNTLAVAVASFGDRAKVTTSVGPMKMALNGEPQDDATEGGVELKGFKAGVSELTLGAGSTRRTLNETFAATPTLTVFLKSDANTGMLTINTGQSDVRVFINDKEYPQKTRGGQLRIPMLGPAKVRVQKNLYDEPPVQNVVVAKGSTARLDFKMKLLPEFSVFQIAGGTPGAEIQLDKRPFGSIGLDGTFRNSSVPPGSHVIDLKRDDFEPKQLSRVFAAGQTMTLSANEATLAPVKVAAPPPPPKVEPPPVVAVAPKAAPAPKPVKIGTMAEFDIPGAWKEQGGIFRHRGTAQLTYSLPSNGTFTFTLHLLRGGTVFRGGKVQWFVDYVDAKNYGLYQLDESSLVMKVIQDGKSFDRGKVAVKLDKNQHSWPLQIDIAPGHVITRIQKDGAWQDLDTWSEPGRSFAGKFGVLINGDDEVGLSDFRFVGR